MGQNRLGFKWEDALSPKWRIGCKATQTVDPFVGQDLYVKGGDKFRISPFGQERGKSKKAIGQGKSEMMPFGVLFSGPEYIVVVCIRSCSSCRYFKRGNGNMHVLHRAIGRNTSSCQLRRPGSTRCHHHVGCWLLAPFDLNPKTLPSSSFSAALCQCSLHFLKMDADIAGWLTCGPDFPSLNHPDSLGISPECAVHNVRKQSELARMPAQ